MLSGWARAAVLAAAALAASSGAPASRAADHPVPTPAVVLGSAPCADYTLATSEQIADYFRTLAAASDRVRLLDIGPTTGGRRQQLAVISSPANLRDLARHQRTARALALNRDDDGAPLTEAAAQHLAADGRVVIWIDFGLHSTEAAPAQAAPWLAWTLITGDTPEIRRIRERAIVLLMPDMNPDGTTVVAKWYRAHKGTPWELTPPGLFHRYAGHDINRDWFMFTQRESRNVAHQLYEVFLPQIVVDHHQAAPFPARIFVPPFSEPANPHIPPQVLAGVEQMGLAIQQRLAAEGKRGVISRVGFDTWWNGGMRTAPYFHNMIGLLTETAHPSPTPATYDAATFPRAFANGQDTRQSGPTYRLPYLGGHWTFRQSCDYILSASMAVLVAGAADPARWQFGMYAMARAAMRAGADETYVIPAEQWDPGAVATLVDALRRGGIQVERTTADFTAGGRPFTAGAFLVRGGQPFLAAVRDLLTPQRYPDRRAPPDGVPDTPYDITGWTLSLQAGVNVQRVQGAVSAAQVPVRAGVAAAGRVVGAGSGPLAIDPRANAAFTAVNRLLRDGAVVARTTTAIDTLAGRLPPGTFLVAPREGGLSPVTLAPALGLTVTALQEVPAGPVVPLHAWRVAVYSPWAGNTDEGWTRWVLEEHAFDPAVLRPAEVRAGHLRATWDVILLPDATYAELRDGVAPGQMPEPFTGGLGEAGIRHLQKFVLDGGTLVAQDGAGELPRRAFGLPVINARAGLSRRELYVPGSLLRVAIDTAHPLGWGLPDHVAAFVADGPVFEPRSPSDASQGASPVAARYDDVAPLLSGWAVGVGWLRGRAAALDLPLGRGHVVLLGLRAQHRGQSLGTFKLLFNAIALGAPTPHWSTLR